MEPGKLWNEYLVQQNPDTREKLITAYLPLVRTIAGRLAIKVTHLMHQEDLEGYGVIGLMEAINKFDPHQGVGFETFAYHRIRGAMLDELRRQSWVPRTVWQRQQAIKAAREKLVQQGCEVTDNLLAEMTGLTAGEVRRQLAQINAGQVCSLDEELTSGDGETLRRGDMVEDENSPDPLDIISETEDKTMLVEAIKHLKERDQLILSLYYQEELTLKEIGAVLEVSESRVCQLHGKALERLKKILWEKINQGR